MAHFMARIYTLISNSCSVYLGFCSKDAVLLTVNLSLDF